MMIWPLFLAVIRTAASAGTVLVGDGKSDFTVVLSEAASPSEVHAADELRSFVAQVTGAELPLVTAGPGLPAHGIFVGDSDALQAYMPTKLLWDAHADPNALVHDFLRGYFGMAARPIRPLTFVV